MRDLKTRYLIAHQVGFYTTPVVKHDLEGQDPLQIRFLHSLDLDSKPIKTKIIIFILTLCADPIPHSIQHRAIAMTD